MKITIRLVLILVIVTNVYLNGQSPRIDSSLQELRVMSDDDSKAKAKLIQFIASTYIYENLDSSFVWANKLLDYAQSKGFPFEEAKAYQFIANYYKRTHQFDTALILINNGLDILDKHNEIQEYAALLSFKGNIYMGIPKYERAKACFLESLEISSDQNDTMMIGIALNGLGNVSDYSGNYEEAIDYHLESLRYFQVLQDSFHISDAYSNIGIIFHLMNDVEKAIDYTWKAIAIKKSLNNYSGLCNSYSNLYVFHSNNNQLDSAEFHLNKAQFYAEHYGSKSTLYNIISKKASLNMNKGKYKLAYEEYYKTYKYYKEVNSVLALIHASTNVGNTLAKLEDYSASIPFFEESIKLSKEHNYLDGEEGATKSLLFALLELEEYKKLSEHIPNYLQLKDSLLSSEKQATINELEIKFKTEQKDAENLLLKKESELNAITLQKQRFILWGIGLLLIIASLLIWMLYKANQLKKSNNKLLAKEKNVVETLHLELAHRIKNNLLFMSTLLKMQGKRAEKEETQVAIKESELRLETMAMLHSKLDLRNNSSTVNIKDYLQELVQNLILTFPKKLNTPNTVLDISDVYFDGDQALRLGLIINELITNSLKHAFDDFDILNPEIRIALSIGEDEERILVYADNGKGISEDLDDNNQESLGLKLIQALTKQLNGRYSYSYDNGSVFSFCFNSTIHFN